MSDTLINAAYAKVVMEITLGIKKLSDPLERLFLYKKSLSFENIKIYSNRSNIDTIIHSISRKNNYKYSKG